MLQLLQNKSVKPRWHRKENKTHAEIYKQTFNKIRTQQISYDDKIKTRCG